MADKAESAVAEANASLEASLKEVRLLKNEHLVEVKSLGSPPQAVRVVLAAVVILMSDHIKKVGSIVIENNKETGKKEENYFATAKLYLLSNPKELLDLLLNFDREKI